ncbi:acetyl-CoA carboxylase biotin carboxyl carrier protein [Anaerotignum lactatifermentans]|uniref:acetyl-CoA carboxylase biotin carboxyl carrier protein n=1 Tax=Anaerotignum lactatifermentans TaxID=160404 RepID=UPI002675918D|nr:acetyl-CoA carboxylase biotin carboxyl carrier protein [Anaerotignum lactatifermentans]
METTKIAELAKILKDNGLTKLDLTEGDNRLVLEAISAPVAPAVVVPAAVPVEAVPVAAAEAPAAPAAPVAPEEDLYEQKTPLVGTVYMAPQAGAAPYVAVGDHVAAGDTVCIVESMKMFNEIAAECSGTIEEICVNNGQIVEYGQVLFRIRED